MISKVLWKYWRVSYLRQKSRYVLGPYTLNHCWQINEARERALQFPHLHGAAFQGGYFCWVQRQRQHTLLEKVWKASCFVLVQTRMKVISTCFSKTQFFWEPRNIPKSWETTKNHRFKRRICCRSGRRWRTEGYGRIAVGLSQLDLRTGFETSGPWVNQLYRHMYVDGFNDYICDIWYYTVELFDI